MRPRAREKDPLRSCARSCASQVVQKPQASVRIAILRIGLAYRAKPVDGRFLRGDTARRISRQEPTNRYPWRAPRFFSGALPSDAPRPREKDYLRSCARSCASQVVQKPQAGVRTAILRCSALGLSRHFRRLCGRPGFVHRPSSTTPRLNWLDSALSVVFDQPDPVVAILELLQCLLQRFDGPQGF